MSSFSYEAALLALIEKHQFIEKQDSQTQIIEKIHSVASRIPDTEPGSKPSRSKEATLWVYDLEGNLTEEVYGTSKEAQEAGQAAAESHKVRWARAFNGNTGKVFIGEGWVYNRRPGDKTKNMPLKYWVDLTAPERHKVKETEIPKYKKPGWECKDLSVREAKWQSVGTSRRGTTYDRRNNSQGIPYKHRADFGTFPFIEK